MQLQKLGKTTFPQLPIQEPAYQLHKISTFKGASRNHIEVEINIKYVKLIKYVIPNKSTNKTVNSYKWQGKIYNFVTPVLKNELSDFENEEKLFCRKQFSWEEEIYGGQQ